MYIEVKLLNKVVITSNTNFLVIDTLPLAKSLDSNPDARFYMSATAVGGTDPTLDVDIKAVMGVGEEEGGSIDFGISSLDQITGNGKSNKTVNNCPRFIQIFAAIGGTSGPTFTIELWVAR